MKLIQVAWCLVVSSIAAAQIWDPFFWPEEAEGEYDEDGKILFNEDDYDENYTSQLKLIQMSSTQLKEEQDLLDESTEIIIDEILSVIRDDLIEKYSYYVNDIISEHTVQLFNVLHQIQRYEDEPFDGEKFVFNDIYIWSNESEFKIKEILDDYYYYG